MNSYTSTGHKDWFTKFVVYFTVFFYLFSQLLSIYLFSIQNSQAGIWFGGSFVLLIVVFLLFNIQSRLIYVFSDAGIEIKLGARKSWMLDKSDIISVEYIKRTSWLSGWGVKYNFWNKTLYFTTSSKNLLKITMNDGRKIIISPKLITDELKKVYNIG